MMRIAFSVLGTPVPQGSKRFVGTRAGRGIMVESSKHLKPWRALVTSAAHEAMDGLPPLTGPLNLDVTFRFARPKKHYRHRPALHHGELPGAYIVVQPLPEGEHV